MLDYFAGRRMKIVASNSPSFIRARFGSWVSMSLGDAQGEVEANVIKRNGGSYVNLNLNFLLEYLGSLIGAIIGATIIFAFVWWRATTNPLNKPDALAVALWFGLVLSMLASCLIMVVAEYHVSLSRRRFIEEFNMFIQSLTSKRD